MGLQLFKGFVLICGCFRRFWNVFVSFGGLPRITRFFSWMIYTTSPGNRFEGYHHWR